MKANRKTVTVVAILILLSPLLPLDFVSVAITYALQATASSLKHMEHCASLRHSSCSC